MLLRYIISERSATEMLYSGEFVTFAEAKKIGLIDEIYSIETVEQKATEKAVDLSGFQAHAFSAVKSCRTEEIRDRYEKNFKSQNEIFLDCWFSESTQENTERCISEILKTKTGLTISCSGQAGRIGNETYRQPPPAAELKRYTIPDR